MSLSSHTLPKEERLHGKKDISRLLAEGRFGTVAQLKYCIRDGNGLPYSRIMVSVPKKLFKRAVKRNLIKRRLRESYRLQKRLPGTEGGSDIMFIYGTKEILPFKDIYALVGQVIGKAGAK